MLSRNDKRNFFRMLVNANVQILINDPESGREIDGICRDLSATGMALEIDEPLEMGTMLHLKLESSNPSVEALDAHAKVIRCSQESEDLYQIGVLFVELN
jgi:c-di-GMP-binding flagellar brake protein YcgR